MRNTGLVILLAIGTWAFAMLLKNWAEKRPEFEGIDWAKETGLLETPPQYPRRGWHSWATDFLLCAATYTCCVIIVASTILVAQLLAAVALVLLITCRFRVE